MTTTRPLFGGKAGASAGVFEHYIKTFRDKKTEVTFAFEGDPLEDEKLFSYREHYDYKMVMPGARKAGVSYGCAIAEGAENCIGCEYPVDHPEWTDDFLKSDDGKAMFGDDTNAAKQNRRKADPGWGIRNASGRWVMPVIDKDGNVNLMKIGWNFIKYLHDMIEQVGPLEAQRFFVLKLGEGLDTTYSILPTNQPPWTTERDVPPFSEISDLLGKKYLEAFQAYVDAGLTTEDGRPTGASLPDTTGEDSQAPAADEAQATIGAGQEPVADKTPASDAAKARAEEPKMPSGLEGLDIPDGWNPFLTAREATPTQLKEWLDNDPRGAHDYPPRAPRGVLVSLVEKAQVPF